MLPHGETMGTGHTLKHKSLHLHVRKLVFPEGGQMLAQVAHRGCVVSILGDTEASPGCRPEQSALVDPAEATVGPCPPASALLCI